MENTVSFGSTDLVMCHPGILLDPNIDPDSRSQFAKAAAFYDILDSVPARTPMWTPSGRQLSQVYEFVFDNREYPKFVLKADEKSALDGAKSFLFEADGFTPKGAYAEFNRSQTTYADAIVDENSLGEDDPKYPKYQTARVQAAQHYKDTLNAVSRTLYTYNYWSNVDGAAWWEAQHQRYIFATRVTGVAQPVPVANLFPTYKTLLSHELKWTKITLSAKDLYKSVVDHEWSSSTSGGGGFWRWSASYSRNTRGETHDMKETRKVAALEFEVTRAQIRRPWLNSVVFSHRGWRIRNDARFPSIWQYSGNLQISDGLGRGGIEGSSLAPFVQTGILLARNVKITFENADEASAALKTFSEINGGASVGFWCFSAKGNYNSTDSYGSKVDTLKQNGASLEIGDAQIIGFYVASIPKCPDPAPGLFENDANAKEKVALSVAPQEPVVGRP